MRAGLFVSAVLAIVLCFTQLGAARLWDRDEPRNAQCAREMAEAGNWVVPMFDGELRTHKPVLLYWCQMAAYAVFGIDEFSARLPSAVAGVITVLLTYWIAIRLASPVVAAWSASALASMALFLMAARAATPDALLIASITGAIALFVHFAFVPVSSDPLSPSSETALRQLRFTWPRWWQWSVIYSVCGIAVLAKGPVGLVLPIAVIGLTCLLTIDDRECNHEQQLQRLRTGSFASRWTRWCLQQTGRIWNYGWKMRPLTALLMATLLAGPWYVAVWMATDGVWVKEFLFTHNVQRAVGTMEGHSGPPILFYMGALLAGTFPWSCFAIPLGIAVWKQQKASRTADSRTMHPLFALGIAWTAVFIGCFSVASTKLPSYITPCYPGVALLVGWYFQSLVAQKIWQPRWALAALGTALAIGAVWIVAAAGPLATLLPSVRPLAIGGLFMVVAAIIAIAFVRRQQQGIAIRAFAIGGVLMIFTLHGFGPALVDQSRTDLDELMAAFQRWPQRHWVTEGAIEPSWVFYSNRRVHHLEDLPKGTHWAEKSLGGIERLGQPEAGSVPVFLNDEHLRILNGPKAKVAAAQ